MVSWGSGKARFSTSQTPQALPCGDHNLTLTSPCHHCLSHLENNADNGTSTMYPSLMISCSFGTHHQKKNSMVKIECDSLFL